MKQKILEINNEEWIKKIHYDKLAKSKVKIIHEKQNYKTPTNPENTLAVFSHKQVESIEKIMGDTEEFYGEPQFKKHPDTDKAVIKIRDTYYSYDYFIQAEQIAKAFNINAEYSIRVSKKPYQPVLLDFNVIKIIIAPRIDDGVLSASCEVKK